MLVITFNKLNFDTVFLISEFSESKDFPALTNAPTDGLSEVSLNVSTSFQSAKPEPTYIFTVPSFFSIFKRLYPS